MYVLDLRQTVAKSSHDFCTGQLNVHSSDVERCISSVQTTLQLAYADATSPPVIPSLNQFEQYTVSSQLHAGFRKEDLLVVLSKEASLNDDVGSGVNDRQANIGVGTVVLNLSNKGYIKWISGWVNMVTSHGVKASITNDDMMTCNDDNKNSCTNKTNRTIYLIVALDLETEIFCKDKGYTYIRWRGPSHSYLGSAKLAATRDILALGVDVVCSEMDVLWVQNPLPLLGVGIDQNQIHTKNDVETAEIEMSRNGDALQWNPEICHWCPLQSGWRPNPLEPIRGEDADLQFSSHALLAEVNIGFYYARARNDGRTALIFQQSLHAIEIACRKETLDLLDVVMPQDMFAETKQGWPTNACAKIYNKIKSWRLDQFLVDQVISNSRPLALSNDLKVKMLGFDFSSNDTETTQKRNKIIWKKLDNNIFGSGDGVDTYSHLVTIHAFQPMHSKLAMKYWFDPIKKEIAMIESKTGWSKVVELAIHGATSTNDVPVYLPQLVSVAGNDGWNWILRGSPKNELSCQGILLTSCWEEVSPSISVSNNQRKKRTMQNELLETTMTSPQTHLRMLSPYHNQVMYADSDWLVIDSRIVGPRCKNQTKEKKMKKTWMRICFGVSWSQWLFNVQREYSMSLGDQENEGQLCKNVTLSDMCGAAATDTRLGKMWISSEWKGRMMVSMTAVEIIENTNKNEMENERKDRMSLSAFRTIETVAVPDKYDEDTVPFTATSLHDARDVSDATIAAAATTATTSTTILSPSTFPIHVDIVRPVAFTIVSSNFTITIDVTADDPNLIKNQGNLQQWLQSISKSSSHSLKPTTKTITTTTGLLNLHLCLAMTSLHFPVDAAVRRLGCVPLFDTTVLDTDDDDTAVRSNSALGNLHLTMVPYGEHDLIMDLHVDDGFGNPAEKKEMSSTVRFLSLPIVAEEVKVGQSYLKRDKTDYLTCRDLRKNKNKNKNKNNNNNNHQQANLSQKSIANAFARGYQSPEQQQLAGQVTLGVLVHRGTASFTDSVQSWYTSDLYLSVSEIIVYLQEWPFPNDNKPRSLAEVANLDARLASMLKVSMLHESTSTTPNVIVIGAPQQVNIAPALARLVEMSSYELFMFLEEDFMIDHENDIKTTTPPTITKENIQRRLEEATRLLLAPTIQAANENNKLNQNEQSHSVDVIRLRSKIKPGIPNCGKKNWKGREKQMLSLRSGDISRHKVLDSTSWLKDPNVYFPKEMVWQCSSLKKETTWWCAYSTHGGWSNNPFIARTEWLLNVIVPIAKVDWTKRVESAVSLSIPLWDHKCYIIATGDGIFTHRDKDQPLEIQSPCEKPRTETILL